MHQKTCAVRVKSGVKALKCFELLTNPKLLNLDYVKIPANLASLKIDFSNKIDKATR